MERQTKTELLLRKYVPEVAVPYVYDLMRKYPCRFIISKPRKTKLGDFRKDPDGKPRITVNGDLNEYSFLITTVHEFAHLIAFQTHGRSIRPHGNEWQGTYRDLLLPLIDMGAFPNKLSNALINSLVTVKASSCSDTRLYRVLSEFDKSKDDEHVLESLSNNEEFILNGKVFLKGNLRRSRYVCTEKHSQRTYLVHALAKVKKVSTNEQ